jgi:hypothetical protein
MRKLRGLGALFLLLAALVIGGCFLFPNHPPVAFFTFTYSSEDPLVVTLDASDSFDEDGDEIVAYMWTFRDDVTIIEPLDSTRTVTAQAITIEFPVEATYTVTLMVRDARGEPPRNHSSKRLWSLNLRRVKGGRSCDKRC